MDIYDGSTLIGTAAAGMYREDLLNVLGSPYHGFGFPTPASLRNGVNHSITVYVHGTSSRLPGTWNLNCTGASNLQGALDGVGCDSISGWAWDSNNPSGVVNVDLYAGSTLITTVTATLYRQDLQNVYGSPYHGFTYPMPSSLRNGQSVTITAKFGGTSTNLTWNNPQSFTCPSNFTPNLVGSMDAGNCTSVTGYAWDTNNDRCTIDVAIYKDGAFQVVIPAQQQRSGVGNGYHGFIYTIPSGWKDGAQHSISVKFSGTSTWLANSPQSITCH